MNTETITDQLHDRILGGCRGGYLGISWCVTDAEGNPKPNAPLEPGMFIATENYYGYAVLRVNADMTLTECTKEELE
jgi:hypothetical protein